MLSIPQPRLYLDRMGGIGFRTHVGRLWVNLVATGRFIAFCRSPVSAIQHDRARNLYQENPSYKYDRTLLLLKPSLGPQLLSSDGLCSRLVKAFAKRRCRGSIERCTVFYKSPLKAVGDFGRIGSLCKLLRASE